MDRDYAPAAVPRRPTAVYGQPMHTIRRIVSIAAAGVLLAGCSAPEPPDLTDATRLAVAFETQVSEREDALGVLSNRVTSRSAADENPSVQIDFASDMTLSEVLAACFGSGEVQIGFTVREGSSWSGVESQPTSIACTGEPTPVTFRSDLTDINAVMFSGRLVSGDGAVASLALFGDATD